MTNTTNPYQYEVSDLLTRTPYALMAELEGLVTPEGDALSRAAKAMLVDAVGKYADTTKRLQGEAEYLIREMERLTRACEEHQNVNSLGAIQGKGSSMDILCALRAEAAQAVTRAAYYVNGELAGTEES